MHKLTDFVLSIFINGHLSMIFFIVIFSMYCIAAMLTRTTFCIYVVVACILLPIKHQPWCHTVNW